MFKDYRSKYMEKPPDGYKSVLTVGKKGPDFNDSIVLPNGVEIPFKEAIPTKNNANIQSPYNIYTVYDTSQIRMCYLVEVL